MRCPGCKAENKDGVKFCKHCGFNIKEYNENKTAIFCTECGTKLDSDTRHCTECGAAVENEQADKGFDSFFELDEMEKLLDSEISKTKESVCLRDFEYITHTDGSFTVTGVKDKSALSYALPEGVVCIGEGAFRDSKAMSVALPEGLLIIEDYAFSNCKNLEKINYPKSLVRIGNGAFTGCESLSVPAPKGVRIGENAYTGTAIPLAARVRLLDQKSLLNTVMLEKVETELSVVGAADENATELIVPEGITRIGYEDGELRGDYLKVIYISSTVETIHPASFDSCPELTEIIVSEDNESFTSIDGVLYSKDCTNLVKYPASKSGISFTVPDTVTEILSSAFSYCNEIRQVTIGKNVKLMEPNYCFDGTELTGISISQGNPCFKEISGMVLTKDGKKLIAQVANKKSESVLIPVGVTSICAYAFCENHYLKSVRISEGVRVIGEFAFEDCESLQSVAFPSSLEIIEDLSFEGCASLKTVDIPMSVKKIGYSAFRGTGIKEVKLPSACAKDFSFAFPEKCKMTTK